MPRANPKGNGGKESSTATIRFEADIAKGHADTFRSVQHPDPRADYVLANS